MNNNNFIERSSLFLENGSYLKLNTIMLSYNLDKLKKWGINNARLSLTAENVAIIKSKKIHLRLTQVMYLRMVIIQVMDTGFHGSLQLTDV